MPQAEDILIVLLVAGARLLVPLAIPKYPVPASLAAIVADFVDGTLQDAFASAGLTDYQGYDKAFDVYYLAIQYLSTMRNWVNLFAFRLGRFLFYYRLAGGILFELSHVRALFLFFPNTFEYFYLLYETIRLRWNPKRMSHGLVIGAAFAIWVFIKIPQEYWIHIVQLGVGDVKENVFRVPAETGWGAIAAQRRALVVALVVIVLVVIAASRWIIVNALPPADWPLAFDADAHDRDASDSAVRVEHQRGARRLFDTELIEKAGLVSMVTVIFSRMLPSVRADAPQTAVAVTIVIVANTAISEWLVRRGVRWSSVLAQFAVMAIANAVLAGGFWLVLPRRGGQLDLAAALFSLLLLTLLVTLYDRYRPIYLARSRHVDPTGKA